MGDEILFNFFFFFSSRRRHTRCREVSWARRCVQETDLQVEGIICGEQHVLLQSGIHLSVQVKVLWFIIFMLLKQHVICLGQSMVDSIIYIFKLQLQMELQPVSYTHLTLPTILLVQISVVAVSLKKKKKIKSIYYAIANHQIK
eukprot:TRINITY_DN1878_c0_g1_i5.p1 TRINITY_DN1878_c0_g1~~TRINITY_DN1878_c0_g1_i5.p1  ORF type:complete len:144 (-),score=38.30 TRINITY_DN1878_c0_g1_i5:11-442(-)